MKDWMLRICLSWFLLSVYSCTTVKINLSLKPQKDINLRDDFGDPVPVAIRIYQLNRADRFTDTQPAQLFKNDRNMLKGDILDVKKMHIYMEKELTVKVKKVKDVKYIGIAGMLKNNDSKYSWKKVFSVSDKNIETIDIKLKRESDSINIKLIPTEKMNADKRGNPLPLTVKIYQLRVKEKFEQAKFTQLWKTDLEVLADDLINMQKINVYPGKNMELAIKKTSEVEYLGIIGVFREPNLSGNWKKLIDLKEIYLDQTDLMVILNGDNIEFVTLKTK